MNNESGRTVLPLPDRLTIVYDRLDRLPTPVSADEALAQLNATLEQVEDEFSGVPRNPNPPLKFDGRMYPPRDDFIERAPGGGIIAITRGNRIEITPNGSTTIYSRRTEEVVHRREGAPTVETHAERLNDRISEIRNRLGPRPSNTTAPAPDVVGRGEEREHPEAEPDLDRGPDLMPGPG